MPRMCVQARLAALPAMLRRQRETYLYRVYITEMMRLAPQSKAFEKSWREWVQREPRQAAEDTRSVEEQAEDFIRRAGLVRKEDLEGGEEA